MRLVCFVCFWLESLVLSVTSLERHSLSHKLVALLRILSIMIHEKCGQDPKNTLTIRATPSFAFVSICTAHIKHWTRKWWLPWWIWFWRDVSTTIDWHPFARSLRRKIRIHELPLINGAPFSIFASNAKTWVPTTRTRRRGPFWLMNMWSTW